MLGRIKRDRQSNERRACVAMLLQVLECLMGLPQWLSRRDGDWMVEEGACAFMICWNFPDEEAGVTLRFDFSNLR